MESSLLPCTFSTQLMLLTSEILKSQSVLNIALKKYGNITTTSCYTKLQFNEGPIILLSLLDPPDPTLIQILKIYQANVNRVKHWGEINVKLWKKKITGLLITVIFTSIVVLQYLLISGYYLMDFPHLKQKYEHLMDWCRWSQTRVFPIQSPSLESHGSAFGFSYPMGPSLHWNQTQNRNKTMPVFVHNCHF